eukprot:gene36445-44209_t
MERSVVVAFCGLPGAGKTTLATELSKWAHSQGWKTTIVSYDEEASKVEWDESSFHRARQNCQRIFHSLLAHPNNNASPDGSNYEDTNEDTTNTLNGHTQTHPCSPTQLTHHLIILDDNMHLRSMRRAIYVVCRDTGTPRLLVHCHATADVCYARNSRRDPTRKVSDDSFYRMVQNFQIPEESPPTQSNTPMEASSTSALKQGDDMLRKLSARLLANTSDKKHVGEVLSAVKKQVLGEVRRMGMGNCEDLAGCLQVILACFMEKLADAMGCRGLEDTAEMWQRWEEIAEEMPDTYCKSCK